MPPEELLEYPEVNAITIRQNSLPVCPPGAVHVEILTTDLRQSTSARWTADWRRTWAWLRMQLDALPDLFWVSGLGLLQILALNCFLPRDEVGEWRHYLAMATIFPLCVLGTTAILRQQYTRPALISGVRLILAGIGVTLTFYFLRHTIDRLAVIAGLVQAGELLLLARIRRGALQTTRNPAWWWDGAVSLLILIPAWTAASRLVWWVPFTAWISGALLPKILFALFVVLVPAAVYAPGTLRNEQYGARKRGWLIISNLFAFALLALISLRVDDNSDSIYHHLSAIAGPVELVRQGGWLLWDVPSQYGFLNTLLVAEMPFETVWQSFYVFHALLLLAGSYALFSFLRQSGRGPLHYVCALLISIVAVHVCWGQAFLGPQIAPSVGPYRFLWVYAFTGLLFWELKLAYAGDFRWAPAWLGTAFWCLGTLWSAESAVYSAAIWVPAYWGMLFRRCSATADARPVAARIRKFLLCLPLPAIALVGTMLCVSAYYWLRLGHGPDWRCFFDHSLAFKNGFAGILINPEGAVSVLLLVFFSLATLTAVLIRRSASWGVVGVVVGVCAGCWAVSSYFIPRSHENNVCNLLPVLCVAMSVLFYVIRQADISNRTAHLLRIGFVPLLTVILAIPFGNPPAVSQALTAYAGGYHADFGDSVPVDREVLQLREQAHLAPDEPVISIHNTSGYTLMPPAFSSVDANGVKRWQTPPAWLPSYPAIVLQPLSEERRLVYMRRFAERRPRDGWLMLPKDDPGIAYDWAIHPLPTHYHPTKTIESEHWRLVRYERNVPEEP